MVDQRLKELRGTGRRDFLRWSATVAACLGLERARFLNMVNDSVGTAAADTAACSTTKLAIITQDGNGGLSNSTQIFPFPKVIASTNAAYSHYALGQGKPSVGYDNPWTYAPDSPWQTGDWKVSAFIAGNNETHTSTPTSATSVGANTMMASIAAIQQANPTLLPVLSVGGIQFGTAPGAPAVAAVGAANQLVDLFNSAASRALLQAPDNGALAESYYKAFIGLNAAAGRTTIAKQYGIGKVSMNLLSKNLSAQLTPSTADLAVFGITSTSPSSLVSYANALITTVKAFSLGLTSMLAYSGPFKDDPHGLFASGDTDAQAKAMALGKVMDGLHDFAKSMQDPSCSAKTLADNMMFAVSGDTHKAPFNRSGWGDGTPNGSNMLYVMGGGYLKTGFFGDMDPTAGASAWDPATGLTAGSYTGKGTMLGVAAASAALYAAAKGDARRVADFSPQAIPGVININVTGS